MASSGALSTFDGLDDGVLRAARGDVQAVAGDGERLVVAGVDGQAEEAVLFGGFVLHDEAAEQGIRRDGGGVGHCDGAAGGVVDGHGGEVLDEGSAAPDVERLHAEADAEQRLAQVMGVLEEQLVDGLAAGVGGGGLGFGVLAVLLRVDVGAAAGEQDALAAVDEVGDGGCGRLSGTSTASPPAALDRHRRTGARSARCSQVGAVGDGDGDAGLHDLMTDDTGLLYVSGCRECGR